MRDMYISRKSFDKAFVRSVNPSDFSRLFLLKDLSSEKLSTTSIICLFVVTYVSISFTEI